MSEANHRAEALRLVGLAADSYAMSFDQEPGPQLDLQVAAIHSNLAIAEGQERVAEELAELRKLFASTNGAFAEIQVDGHITTGMP